MPETVSEACRMLAASTPDSTPVPMAGGTDLMVHWPTRHDAHEQTYLDLSRLDELKSLTWTDDELTLGGLTTYWDVITDDACTREFPLLATAGRQVGAIQIQSRGTWAGNIVNASPAADGVPVLMAYDATVVLVSQDGTTDVPLSEFYLGYKKMKRQPDQLIQEIRIPRRAYSTQVFEKVGSRRAQAITKVGVAITHSDQGWRVVANSVAPTVRRCSAVEQMLNTEVRVTSPAGFLDAIDRDVSPIDDIRSTAIYRRRTLAQVLYHALTNECPFVGPDSSDAAT